LGAIACARKSSLWRYLVAAPDCGDARYGFGLLLRA
jgi:hypothetical protein